MKETKVAVVTGGSSGMGLAISKKLKNLGFHVIIFDIQSPLESFEFYHVDIRDDKQIISALLNIPKLDILVNNAGVYFEKYLEDTTNEELDRMVDINIKGTYLMTRNALAKIKAAKGSIVIIVSCLGLVPELTSPLYCTTKAGLIMLTKCLAQQYAEHEIRVNCILPGPINTPLLQKSFPDEESAIRCAERIPMKRIGEPEDIANMVAFLISEDAKYITGGAFPVDGGVSSSSLYSK
ncbi:MAG: SDR family oxidoreductase [Mobilitalea sp.]